MSFRVPEISRVTHGPLRSSVRDGRNGAFDLESPEPGWRLALIASDGTDPECPEGAGWEHVSIHAYRDARVVTQMRTPTWKEMAFVKALCWEDEDVVMQLHPKRSEYVNNHPHVLHLWRPRHAEIPTPPPILVGILSSQEG